LYQRLLTTKELQDKVTWVALGITLLIGAMILVPLGYGLMKLLNEAQSLGQLLTNAQEVGIPPPAWLDNLPMISNWAKNQWQDALGNAVNAKQTLHWLGTGGAVTHTKDFAGQLMRRIFNFFIILVVLFFVYRHGTGLGDKALLSCQKWFGASGVRYATHAVAAVRATVNGLVLVGLGVGLFLSIGYTFAGFSHPAVLGAMTGIFGIVPILAKTIISGCVLLLFAQGNIVEASSLLLYGLVVVLLADNVVRPKLIGDAVKLPFIWTLLGILGGLENFGLLGLFLGPTLMAVLMSIWRDWVEDMNSLPCE
jgi:predicted PurR-regulated permease PerM